MDRNEKFRRRLENKLNQPIKKESFVSKQNFDASPYVDIILDRMAEEEDDDAQDFIDGLRTNPDFAFILGKTSVLNQLQKTKVLQELMHRLMIAQEFDPEPYAKELSDMWGTPAFDQYTKTDTDDKEQLELDAFFEQHNFTREQKEMVRESFYDLQSEKAGKNRRKFTIPFLITTAMVVVPPFFIPNFLQRIGWLSQDSGWFMKILIGIISVIPLFYIAKTFFLISAKIILNKLKAS